MLSAGFHAAVQRALAESALARELCARLSGRSLGIIVRHTPLAIRIRSDGHTLSLDVAGTADAAATADATIRGSAIGVLAMARPNRRELVQRGVVEISGDSEIVEHFARLLALVRPDFETMLGGLLGRAPGHVLAAAVRRVLRGSAELLDSLMVTTADYLAHERGALVTGAEARPFYRQIHELQVRIAALEARARARAAGQRRDGAQ